MQQGKQLMRCRYPHLAFHGGERWCRQCNLCDGHLRPTTEPEMLTPEPGDLDAHERQQRTRDARRAARWNFVLR